METIVPGETPGRQFSRQDRALDAATIGPTWLTNPEIAQLVADALQHGQAPMGLYELRSWVIMSNHVHLFVIPTTPLSRINRAIRGYTGHEANRMLGRSGPFWQHESYDHWSRNSDESERIIRYIESNPVKAGLVPRPEDWRWSSAWKVG